MKKRRNRETDKEKEDIGEREGRERGVEGKK